MNEDFKNILIVEDEVFASKYLLQILQSLGYKNISESRNADDALEIVKSQKIDVAFMDINIEGKSNGIECSQMINEEYSVPIIYSSAYGDEETINKATKRNSYGYLVKPFEINDVKAVLSVVKNLLRTLTALNKQREYQEIEELELGYRLTYNLINKTLIDDKKYIDLTTREINILDFFCKNKNVSISYDTLRSEVWNNFEISNSTIRDSISRLRKKVPNLELKNIIKFGYVLK